MDSSIVVEGIAYYACVQHANKATGAYSMNLVVDEANAKILRDAGAEQAKDREGNNKSFDDSGNAVFKFKRNGTTQAGENVGGPVVVDSKGNEFKDLLGNGTKVKAKILPPLPPKPGRTTASSYLLGVQVLDLVPYESDSNGMFDAVDGGFVAEAENDVF